jgi:hypothetical protein
VDGSQQRRRSRMAIVSWVTPPVSSRAIIARLMPNVSLQLTGAEVHQYESALMIATGRRFPHIEIPPAAELGR